MNEQEAFKEAASRWMTESKGEDIGAYFWKAALEFVKNGQEPVWLYHCGFKHLHSIITKKAAFVASSVVEGEEITEGMRSEVIDILIYAVEMSRLFAKTPLYIHPAPQPDVSELVDVLNGVVSLCKEAFYYWEQDNEPKVGKILMALSGELNGYHPKATALHEYFERHGKINHE